MYLKLIWIVFSIYALFSFLRLALHLTKQRKLHVACMALSYCLLVCSFTFNELPETLHLCLSLIALLFGIIGITVYNIRGFYAK